MATFLGTNAVIVMRVHCTAPDKAFFFRKKLLLFFLFLRKNSYLWSLWHQYYVTGGSNTSILGVCVEVLRSSQPNGVMSSAVSLPNHTFTGQAKSSKRLTSNVHILSPETDNCPS